MKSKTTEVGRSWSHAGLLAPAGVFLLISIVRGYWIPVASDLGLTLSADAVLQIGRFLTALNWFAFGYLLTRLLRRVIFHLFVQHKGIEISGMLITLIETVIWALLGFMVIGVVYEESMTALLTTSTVLIGIVGFAMRNLIADFFCGIVLSLEKPFSIGDWLEIEPDGLVGKVVDFNWRSTRILSNDEVTIVVPNSYIFSVPFKNFSKPHPYFRDEIRIPLGYGVTIEQGERILLSAVTQIEEIDSLPVRPAVTIADYDSRGVIWALHFWVPNRGRLNSLRYAVHCNILRNLQYAGLEIPLPNENIHLPGQHHSVGKGDVERKSLLLKKLDLFSDLQPEELESLAHGASQRVVKKSESIFSQGDQGSSFYVLVEGLLGVWTRDPTGAERQIAQIRPGGFFGEMSLLTGAPRAATIIPLTDSLVLEVQKEVISALLSSRPAIADHMSLTLAKRQAENDLTKQFSGNVEETPNVESFAGMLLTQIRAFFSLGK